MIINNVNVSFDDKKILDNFSIEFIEGENIAILGKSGTGKTTLFKVISGIIKADGVPSDISLSYIFQENRLIKNLTVLDNLLLVCKNMEKIDFVLEKLEILDTKNMYIDSLSGGMAKRVNIARGLLYDAKFLLIDEGFTGLNSVLKNNIINFIKDFSKKNEMTILLITHDIEVAKNLADKIYIVDGTPLKIIKEVHTEDFYKIESV